MLVCQYDASPLEKHLALVRGPHRLPSCIHRCAGAMSALAALGSYGGSSSSSDDEEEGGVIDLTSSRF